MKVIENETKPTWEQYFSKQTVYVQIRAVIRIKQTELWKKNTSNIQRRKKNAKLVIRNRFEFTIQAKEIEWKQVEIKKASVVVHSHLHIVESIFYSIHCDFAIWT